MLGTRTWVGAAAARTTAPSDPPGVGPDRAQVRKVNANAHETVALSLDVPAFARTAMA